MRAGWRLLCALVFSGACTDGWAADPLAVPWLLGEWNGARTRLVEAGVDFQFGYTGELAYNAAGGVRNEAAYADQYTAGTTLNLQRLLEMHDATFQVTLTARTGRNLSDDAKLGTLQEVQEIYGRGQTGRLTQFWFDQKYFGGTLDWKVGRLTFNEDFASFSCEFENLTFCGSAPGNIASSYIYVWPVSQWATRLKVNLDGFGYVQAGIFDVNPAYAGMQSTLLPVFFPGSTGAMVPVEAAWLPNAGGALPGSYKVGAWYDTSTANDVVSLTPQQGRYGAYVVFTQQLTPLPVANTRSGLQAFFRATLADDRTAAIDKQLTTGLIYTGPFKSRPDDDIGFAVGVTHLNSRITDPAVPGSELTMELHYTLRPINGLVLRPSLQYVSKDVLVLGFTTAMNF